MRAHAITVLTFCAGAALAPATALAQQDSPLRATLALPDRAETGRDPAVVALGQVPSLTLTVSNPSAEATLPEGSLDYGEGWTLGLRGRLRITGPDGRTTEWQPTLADCGARDARRAIAPGETRTASLWLSRFVALTEPGTYDVAVALFDAKGRAIPTDPVRFEVRPAPVAPEGVAVTIEPTAKEGGLQHMRVTFTNRGAKPVTIVTPQDGSLWGWLEPHYWFVVRDASGAIVPPGSRCGNHGATYDEKSLIVLEPGKSHELTVYLPGQLTGGRYTARLHYIMTEVPSTRSSSFPGPEPKAEPLPASARHLLLGRLVSNEVSFEVPGADRRAWLRGPVPEAVARLAADLRALRDAGGEADATAISENLQLMHKLVVLDVLGAEDRAALRDAATGYLASDDTTVARAQAMQLLAKIGDAASVETFAAHAIDGADGMERYYAAEGLKNALGREAAARVAPRLTDEDPRTIEAVCTALEVITGQPFNQLDATASGYRCPSTPEEWRGCRDRWRNWWRVFGQEWIRTGE